VRNEEKALTQTNVETRSRETKKNKRRGMNVDG
jgi:hypothetical protein